MSNQTQMLQQAQERAYQLMKDNKNNIGEKILLMKSGLITVTAKRITDVALKLRVQWYNNSTHRTVEITKWEVMRTIIDLQDEMCTA